MIVVDSEPLHSLGGQAHWSLGGLFLVNSPEQRRLRIHDSEELALADWLGSAGFDRTRTTGRAAGQRHSSTSRPASSGAGCAVSASAGSRWCSGPSVAATPRPGHGNSVPRFHIAWGTGPALVEPFAEAVLKSHRVRIRSRHRVTGLEVDDAGVRVRGNVLAPSDAAPRGAPARPTVAGEFSFSAQAVVVASGGIGGNLELVRRNWPPGWGRAAAA